MSKIGANGQPVTNGKNTGAVQAGDDRLASAAPQGLGASDSSSDYPGVDRSDRRDPTVEFGERGSRASQDHSDERAREHTDEERFELFKTMMANSVLPALPSIPGYHLLWATTDNERDTPQMRQRLGYSFVMPEEIPGWVALQSGVVKSGQLAGYVMQNEMIAMKIPLRLYERYMHEAHHDAPNRNSLALYSRAESLAREAEEMGSRIDIGDGIEALKKEANRKGVFHID